MAGQFENGLRHGNALEVLNDDWVMVIVCCSVCCSVLWCVAVCVAAWNALEVLYDD